MNVKELIAALQEMPQDAQVEVRDPLSEFAENVPAENVRIVEYADDRQSVVIS